MGLYDGLNAIAGGIDRLGSALGDQAALREQKRLELEFETSMLDTRDRIQSEYKRLTDMDPDTLLTYADDTTPGGENLANFRAGLMDIDMTTPLAQERRLATRKLFDQYTPELEKLFEAGRIEKYTPMVQKAAAERMGTGLLRDEDMAALAEEYAPAITRRRSAEIIAGMQKDRAAQLLNQLALKSGNADFYMTGPGERPTDEAEAVAYDQITRAMSYLTPEERRKAYEQTRDTILQFKADEKAARMEQYTAGAKVFQSLINARQLGSARQAYNEAIKGGLFLDDGQIEEWGADLKALEKDIKDQAELTPEQLRFKKEASESALKGILAGIAGTRAEYPDAMAESDINRLYQDGLLTGEDWTKARGALKSRGEGNPTLDALYIMADSKLAQAFPIVSPTNPEGMTMDKSRTEEAKAKARAYIYERFREYQKKGDAGIAELSKPETQARIVKEATAFYSQPKGSATEKAKAISQTQNRTYEEIQSSPANQDVLALAKTGALAAGMRENDPASTQLFNAKVTADMTSFASKFTPLRGLFANGLVIPIPQSVPGSDVKAYAIPDLTIDKDGLPLYRFKLNKKTGLELKDGTVLVKDFGGNPSIYSEVARKWVPLQGLLTGMK